MKCPQCKKNFSKIIEHVITHGYTIEEAERLIRSEYELGDDSIIP